MESVKRLVGVVFAPSETFRRIRERPTWGLILVVLLLLSGAANMIVVQRMDPEAQRAQFRQRLEKQGFAGDELDQKTDKAVEVTQRFAPVGVVFGVVLAGAFYLLIALGLWLGLRLLGGEMTYRQGFSATLHGMIPAAGLKALVLIPVLLSVGSLDLKAVQAGTMLQSNLGFLAPEGASHALVALLTSVDVFSLWSVVLLILGLSVVARVSKGASALMVVGGWVVLVALKVGLVSLSGMFGG